MHSGHIDCMHSYGDYARTRRDAELVLAELLRPWGLKRLTKYNEVDAFWQSSIPKSPYGHECVLTGL
jgi:hypothetical protein